MQPFLVARKKTKKYKFCRVKQPIRVDIDTSLSGENKRQAHTIFGQITKNATSILVYMGKIKGFLFAVRHREVLMTDLG